MYRFVLINEKKESAAQLSLKSLVCNAISAMFQNKKSKRNTTFAIGEVAEVALCVSN